MTDINSELLASPMTEENFRKTHDCQLPKKPTNREKLKSYASCRKSFIFKLVPILSWVPRYDLKKDLVYDLLAGLTVAVLQIPHGLAFAPLGGQEPVVGLYMAIFPIMVYVIFGTSRHISLGMMAIQVMMVGTLVERHATPNLLAQNTTIGYSALQVGITATFSIGLWQTLLGVFQLGSFCVLLSNSVVSGFTCGASIHILLIQLKNVFGISISMPSGPLKLIYFSINFFENIHLTNYVALCTGLAYAIVLHFFNEYAKAKLSKKFDFPITLEFLLLVISIIISQFIDLRGDYDVKVVGHVPSGLPEIIAPDFSLIRLIFFDCLIIALVNLSISISLAKIFAKKGKYEIRENQELIAYGLSNMFGGFFQCLPVCASLSRTMVQFAVGGKTELAHVFSLLSVLIILLSLGPLFENIPISVLSAIVLVTLKGLIWQITELPGIWRASQLDGAVWLVTFATSVLVDIDYGIGSGIITAILVLILRNVQVDVSRIGTVKQTNRFQDGCSYQIEKEDKIAILKIVGAINFVNSHSIERKICRILAEFWERNGLESFVIFDLSSVPYIDPSGANILLILNDVIKANNCELVLTNCSLDIYETLEICDFFKKFPKKFVLVDVYCALEYINSI